MAELEAPISFGYFGFDELSHSSVNIDSCQFCKVSIAITGCEEVSYITWSYKVESGLY